MNQLPFGEKASFTIHGRFHIFVLLFNGILVLQLGIQYILLHLLDSMFHLFENLVACHTAVDLHIGSALILAHLCAHALLLKFHFSSLVLIYTYAGYPSYVMYIIYTNIQYNSYRSLGSSLISSLIISVNQVLHHVNGWFYSKPAFTINLRPPKTSEVPLHLSSEGHSPAEPRSGAVEQWQSKSTQKSSQDFLTPLQAIMLLMEEIQNNQRACTKKMHK